jgi:hypothetical protein
MSATLELVLDASGMQRGAQQATKALDDVGQKATVTSASMQNVGKSMSAAFQATGGTIQVAQGITQTARAFGELNSAAGLFGASRILLEIGKTTDDFRQLGGAVGGVGSVFTRVGAIMRAHPLLTIATLLSAAASAMSLFGDNTKKAASAHEELAKSMREANAQNSTNALLGLGGTDARLGSLQRAVQRTYAPGASSLTVSQLAGSDLGLSPMSVLRFLANNPQFQGPANASRPFGGNTALEYMRTGYYTASGNPFDDSIPKEPVAGSRGLFRYRARPELNLSPEAQRALFASLYSGIQQEDASIAGLYQFGAADVRGKSPFPESYKSSGLPMNYVEQSAQDRSQVEENNRRRQEESAERIRQTFEGIGQDIGLVAADLATGAVTFRQAIASIAQQLLRQGLSSGVGAIFSSFASTAGQAGTKPVNT